MTAPTSNFEGLLYYNPVAHGFNPVVSATVKSDSSPVNEGDDAYVEVITWNIPDDTILYWRITNLVNMTTDRFSALVSSITIENNRAAFIINASADNFTAAGQQSYNVVISKTMNGPALATVTILVNDNSQDPRILTMDLDPKNYVPASSSTITITTTFGSDYCGFPDGSGGSYIRYNGDIATQPSVGDTFVYGGTTYTIAQIMAAETYGTSYQYYFAGFKPTVGQGAIGVGDSIDITHGSDGLTITDSSGQSHPGVIHGTVDYANQGADNAYLILAGASYIDVPSLQNSAYRSVTMSAWFNSDNVSGTRSLIAKEIAYKMRLVPAASGSNSNLNVLAGWDGFSWLYNQVIDYSIPNNQWHHVAVTIAPNQIAIYVDGQQVATAAGVGTLPANSQKLMIGSYGDGTSEFFSGVLGPTRLYTYDLTDENISDYYKSTAGRYGVYAAHYYTQTDPGSPVSSMIFSPSLTQDVTGWTISGYGCPTGVTVTNQTSIAGGTILTLSQAIDTFAVMYSFRLL